MEGEHKFSLEMGFTEPDFIRTIGQFMDGEPYKVNGSRIEIPGAGKTVTISLSGHRERRIGPTIRLPLMDVEFVFAGFPEEERKAFMQRFDMIFRRGGG